MITDEKGFNVVCTNPAKSASIEACWFSYADWTEDAAIEQFCTEYSLDRLEVAVVKED